MTINSRTKYRIPNIWEDGKMTEKFEFHRTASGNAGVGKLYWSTPSKKDGKTTFAKHRINFVCFNDNISFFENNLGATFLIDASLESYSYEDKQDNKKWGCQFKVWKVEVVSDEPRPIDAHNKAKGGAFVVDRAEEFNDDLDIPF